MSRQQTSENRVSDVKFKRICKESISMLGAAAKLNFQFSTFKRRAESLNCYAPNQGLKGVFKKDGRRGGQPLYNLESILNGLHPQYQTYKLKLRLLKEGLKENKCEICGLTKWQNKSLAIELDHIDGNNRNHKLSNLRMLCPNCHSQTGTHRAKNK